MPNSEGTLASALNELTALGTEQDREQLAALLDRLDAARLRVLVVGEAKRGKSTLVNAMLGREVLPSGVTPLTAVTTTVLYGQDERAEVRFLDGHDEKHPLAALAGLVTERGNPGNRRGIAGVTVYQARDLGVAPGGCRGRSCRVHHRTAPGGPAPRRKAAPGHPVRIPQRPAE